MSTLHSAEVMGFDRKRDLLSWEGNGLTGDIYEMTPHRLGDMPAPEGQSDVLSRTRDRLKLSLLSSMWEWNMGLLGSD